MRMSTSIPNSHSVQTSEPGFRRLSSVLLLLTLYPLIIYAYLGTFSRYLADDYCTTSTLRNLGFWGSQRSWYISWSGRFSFTFLINLAQSIGPRFTPFIVAIALSLWFVALVSVVAAWLRLHYKVNWILVFGLTSLILYSTLEGTPDLYQSLYWHTGLVTYVVPLILLTVYLAWLLRVKEASFVGITGWTRVLGGFVLTLLAGGFSETSLSVQLLAFLLLSSILLFFRKGMRPQRVLVLCGLVGSGVSALVVLLAPGNQIRLGVMPTPPDLLSMIYLSLRFTLAFVAKTSLAAPLSTLLAFAVPAAFAVTAPMDFPNEARGVKKPWTSIRGILVKGSVVFLLILGSIVPSVYATSAYPAERALVVSQYIWIVGLAMLGHAFGLAMQLRFQPQAVKQFVGRFFLVWIFLAVLLVGSVFNSTRQELSGLAHFRSFANQWGARDQQIRAALLAGESELSMPSMPHMGGLAEIGPDPDEWINRCVAGTYGLQTIVEK